MIEPPEPYRVSYSGRVVDWLREWTRRTKGTPAEPEFRAAIQKLDRVLRIDPQFGDPLRDLTVGRAQHWFGTFPPLVVHYIIDEDGRQVLVARPPMLLPNSGLDSQQ
jgi:hypothetical protein